ncbi:RND transporter, HAE1/HME family, permease protein [Stenotrophomonas sp. SKA14]|uniref:efflux RND transporter permease subunit n=1 Tax=Stenotrophomonas TaxID=40323 RepID=UPI00018FEB86|nr:efflux RND transporter permease subunit [Stenotrophomonas sp. SKA14]EED41366.1 RND transporter, HAE1/HME family, permease protein [Stenotrophomonas sp. SKA14]
MNLAAPFIRRPIGTLLLALGMMLAGIAAYPQLSVAPLPQIDFPTIVVQASLPGASPQTMSTTVASPLERRLGVIAGVNEMTSQSGVGSAQVTLQFDLSRDIDGAARDVQAAINAARADLPTTLRSNPTYRKMNPADAPILILALTSATRTPSEIYDAVSATVQQRLLQVQGVGNVELGGAALPSVRVELDLSALSQYGIALEDVRTALSSESANRPRGVIDGDGRAFQVYSNTPGLHAADYRDVVVAWRNGAAVRLRDVGSVQDGPEDVRTMGLFNGQPSVSVIISRQPGANIVDTVDAIQALLPALQANLPEDVHLAVASDRTLTIRASLREVETTLVIATLLVVLVVSLFLRSWRATLIPAVAVVASLLGTFAMMYLLDFSLDNLSLMALTVATGFVVDDAIVVVENISRHIEDGMQARAAALLGAGEVGFTVLSISTSLIAVFVPLIFMGGLIGRIFREFALTLSIAVAISLLVSLTVTPMMASLLLVPPAQGEQQGRLMRSVQQGFDRMQQRYVRSLDWALAHRGVMLLSLALAIALNVYLMVVAPKGFFPAQDTGALNGGIRADQSISFTALRDGLAQAVKIIRADPAVQDVVAFSGGSRAGGGFLFVVLVPRGQRPPVAEVVARLRPKLAGIEGVATTLNPVQDLNVGGRQTTSMYQYVLKAEDADQLQQASTRLLAALKPHSDVLVDLNVDQQDAGASAYVEVDRDAAARLGVSMQSVDNALYDAFGQRQVANLYSGLNQYHVVMEAAPRFNGSPLALADIKVPSGALITSVTGTTSLTASVAATALASAAPAPPSTAGYAAPIRTLVPLSAFSRWSSQSAPARLNHSDGEPSATVSFNLPPGIALGQAAQLIEQALDSLHLPASVRGEFGGTARVFNQSLATLPLLIVGALLAIYVVLGILYESAIHPLTVMSTLPAAGVGALLALIVTGSQLDLIALIAIILLIGIVKKNAIMIVDFALEAQRSRGLSALQAIREASILRLRPILMTSLAAGLGALPLAIGFGDGAELRRPLGIAIMGGLLVSQFITLLTTPVVFLALDRSGHARRGGESAVSALPSGDVR